MLGTPLRSSLQICLVSLATITTSAQTPAKTQVNPDHSITFRYTNAGATKVEVSSDMLHGKALPMVRGEDGVWTVTTPPEPPEIYGYNFVVDGVNTLDPLNSAVRRNYVSLSNDIIVPAQPPAPWELADIPHGRVDHYIYTTHVVKNLPENQSSYVVYTPPGYDEHRKAGYPVLYLLHGWSDFSDGWVSVGRANYIFDSMLAEGKIVPMIVVMPLGYGDLDFVTHPDGAWQDEGRIDSNLILFTQALVTEVMIIVERQYNIAHSRENRAIAGLSMGGLESLYVGLGHTGQFAYVAGMSSATQERIFEQDLPDLIGPDAAKKADLKLLWIACGTGDSLIQPNRDFVAYAKTKGLPVTAIETPGEHTWLVWRDNLLHLAPLLFRAK
jgi:enterochelin esterase-like enzyme